MRNPIKFAWYRNLDVLNIIQACEVLDHASLRRAFASARRRLCVSKAQQLKKINTLLHRTG